MPPVLGFYPHDSGFELEIPAALRNQRGNMAAGQQAAAHGLNGCIKAQSQKGKWTQTGKELIHGSSIGLGGVVKPYADWDYQGLVNPELQAFSV